MTKTLMHKNVPVASLKVTPDGILEDVVKVINPEFLPENNGNVKRSLQRWLMLRQISRSRKDISPLRDFYGSKMFISKNMRSLYDCYWLKSESETWEEINAFENWDYQTDDILLALINPVEFEEISYDSPNLTISGADNALWFYDEKHLGQITNNAQRQMNNYKTAVKNGISILKPRKYLLIYSMIFVFTPSDTSQNIESIAFDTLYNQTEDEKLNKMENLQKCCEHFKIPDWRRFINQMMEYDRLCKNSERELSDIRILRDADTLDIIRFDKL